MPLVTRQEKGSKLTIQEMDNNLLYLENLSKNLVQVNRVVVESINDLPTPVNNVIELETDTLYDFNGTISIGVNSLRINEGSFITGRNLSTDTILYTGTDAAIIASDVTVNINNVGIIAPTGKAMDINMFDKFCTIFSCGFYSKDGVHITNGEVVSIKFCMFNNIPGMFTTDNHVIISGNINKLFFSECPFYPVNAGGSAITLDNITINVIHIQSCFFKLNEETSIAINNIDTTPNLFSLVNACTFEGDFILTQGFDQTTPKWDFTANAGIPDSDVIAGWEVNSGTGIDITIDTQNQWYDIIGGTPSYLQRFEYGATNSSLTYIGDRDYLTTILVSGVIEGLSNNVEYELGLFINDILEKTTIVDYRFANQLEVVALNLFRVLSTNDIITFKIRCTSGSENVSIVKLSTVIT